MGFCQNGRAQTFVTAAREGGYVAFWSWSAVAFAVGRSRGLEEAAAGKHFWLTLLGRRLGRSGTTLRTE